MEKNKISNKTFEIFYLNKKIVKIIFDKLYTVKMMENIEYIVIYAKN